MFDEDQFKEIVCRIIVRWVNSGGKNRKERIVWQIFRIVKGTITGHVCSYDGSVNHMTEA